MLPRETSPKPVRFVADLHVHPSLKSALFGFDFAKTYRTSRKMIPFTMRTSLPRLIEGGIDLIFSSVYIPEKKLVRDCLPLAPLGLSFSRLRRFLKSDPDESALTVLQQFQESAEAAGTSVGHPVRFIKSMSDLEETRRQGGLGIVHSIEGAHVLNGKLERVDDFYDSGVRLMTLAHSYENEVVCPVEGVPRSVWARKIGCFRERKDLSRGLSPFGREVVEKLIDRGILIDLTHCTPKARAEIFDIAGNRTPLVFSHVGCGALLDDPMNPTDDEIRRVAETGGLIGVIFMEEWLIPKGSRISGLQAVVETIRHNSRIGGMDIVAVGSDLDGFTNPLDEVKDASEFPRFYRALAGHGFCEKDQAKILGENVVRVLKEVLS